MNELKKLNMCDILNRGFVDKFYLSLRECNRGEEKSKGKAAHHFAFQRPAAI